MKKTILLLFVFASSVVLAQSRIGENLKFTYPNGNGYAHAVGDTVSNAVDTLIIAGLVKGGLAPLAITLSYSATDADVSATPDSLQITYQAGIGGFFTTVGAAQAAEVIPGTPNTRTLVINPTGAAAALNTKAAVFPVCDAVRLLIQDGSLATNDTISYKISAAGVYDYGNIYAHPIQFNYPNGNSWTHAVGDSIASAGIDTLHIGLEKGDLSPFAVGLIYEFKGVGGTRDSVTATYQMGNGPISIFAAQAAAQLEFGASITTGGVTQTRSLIFNTNGASVAAATQALNVTHGEVLRVILTQSSNDSETISYRIRAVGYYKR